MSKNSLRHDAGVAFAGMISAIVFVSCLAENPAVREETIRRDPGQDSELAQIRQRVK
jgi:hypothetical protein